MLMNYAIKLYSVVIIIFSIYHHEIICYHNLKFSKTFQLNRNYFNHKRDKTFHAINKMNGRILRITNRLRILSLTSSRDISIDSTKKVPIILNNNGLKGWLLDSKSKAGWFTIEDNNNKVKIALILYIYM